MTVSEKITQLKNIIDEQLSPLIDANYVLLDVPYYTNIGDTLIWEGTRDFLKKKPYKCLYTASVESYKYQPLPKDVIILMQGGGNFGDLWRRHQELRQSVVENYPENKIIFLPQTVFYKEKKQFAEDAKILNTHKNLHICVRDTTSFEFLQSELICKIHLVPDMAFYISKKSLERYKKAEGDRSLFLKRNDTELQEYNFNTYITEEESKLDICDWPTMEQGFLVKDILDKLLFRRKKLKRIPDIYADFVFRPFLVKKGVEFVSQYKKIYTTRLHVAILSILLKKELVFFDNSYGKNSSFYHTWLQNLDNLKFIQ